MSYHKTMVEEAGLYRRFSLTELAIWLNSMRGYGRIELG